MVEEIDESTLPEPYAITKSKVRKSAPDNMNVASDFYKALEAELQALIEDAARRAKTDGRKTLKARDV